jgi:7TM diverse intracellular signalling/7TMR-DISM extracellular 2
VEQDLFSKNISSSFYNYEEKDNVAESITDILKKENQFINLNTKVSAYFASSAGHWIKLRLISKITRNVILDFGPLSFDELNVYAVDDKRNVRTYPFLSWGVPLEKRPLQNEMFGQRIQLKAHQPIDIFIRGKNPKGTFRIPLRISSEIGFLDIIKSYERFYGLFFGVSLFIISLGISFYFLSKDKSYLYYVISVTCIIIQSAGLNGFLSNSLLSIFPAAADPTYSNLFITFFAFFHIAFLRTLLLDKSNTPKYIWWFSKGIGYGALLLACAMIACLIDNRLFKYMSYFVYIVYSSMVINLILNLKQGLKYNKSSAVFILISNIPFFLYLVYMILTNLRILKQNSPYNIVMWCVMFDNLILCVGLAFRFNRVSKNEVS